MQEMNTLQQFYFAYETTFRHLSIQLYIKRYAATKELSRISHQPCVCLKEIDRVRTNHSVRPPAIPQATLVARSSLVTAEGVIDWGRRVTAAGSDRSEAPVIDTSPRGEQTKRKTVDAISIMCSRCFNTAPLHTQWGENIPVESEI